MKPDEIKVLRQYRMEQEQSALEKDLKEFLKKTPFTYTIVPKASEVSQKYGVEAFPTHIVIDRNGMNVGRLMGGSEKRHEDLRPLIERALE